MTLRHPPRCALCGAPTRLQQVDGLQRLVCVACGTAAVGPEPAPLSAHVPRYTPDFQPRRSEMSIRTPVAVGRRSTEAPFSSDGLAALSEAQFELALERAQATRTRRLTLLVGVATCLLVVLLAVPLSFLVYQAVRTWRQPEVAVPSVSLPLPAPVAPAPAPQPVAAPEAPPDAPPEPPPAAAPSPRARATALVAQGWGLVNRDPVEAASRFQDALALDPGSADANYGVGYALLKQGNPSGAEPWLCTAVRTGDLEVQRDVQSLLDSNSLTCR